MHQRPASTRQLADALRATPAPVVIGENTNGLKEAVGTACLARRPQLNFDAPNVRHGLTRLNVESERLPLRWLVVPETPPETEAQTEAKPEDKEKLTPVFADSLSFAAVKAYDAAFSGRTSIQRLIDEDDHAYADINIQLPRVTSTQLLCSANDATLRARWHLNCTPQSEQAALPKILGKVVLIGAETTSDQRSVLDHEMWGYELQARYIESLLSGDYLRSLPIKSSIILFALYVFLIEGVPVLMLGYVPHWKRKPLVRFAYHKRRFVWVLLCTAGLIVARSVSALVLHYLPPLLVYGDILLLMTTRLLHFSAESAEHPFLHAHHHKAAPKTTLKLAPREAHPMSEHTHHHHHEESAAAPADPVVTSAPTDADPTVDPSAPPIAEPCPPPPPTSSNKPGGEGGSVG